MSRREQAGEAPGFPAAVADLEARLQEAGGPTLRTLCLALDPAYRLRRWRGEPAHFGLGDLLAGMDVRTTAPWLDHFEAGESLSLPFVDTGDGRAVHLHLLPDTATPDGGWYVVLADARDDVARSRVRQQQDNEQRVRGQRLAARLVQATTEGQAWRDQAQQARAATWRLAGTLSHELRTPLAAIAGYARLLEEALAGQPALARQAHTIARSAAQVAELVETTLARYRSDGEAVSLNPRPTDPRRLVSDLTELLAPLAADKAVAFAAFVAPAVPARLQLDPLRLRQVLLNLLGNAVKYTDDGSVRLDAAWAAGVLTLRVADSGPGIAPEHHERIFAAFDRAGREDAGGTGLGLCISRRIVERMGGHIALDSTPGAGSVFTVTVPADAVAGGDGAAQDGGADAASEAAAMASAAPGRVVLAEDDEDLARLFTLFLDRAGFAVELAARADAAVAAALGEPPATLVLLDLHLADGDAGHTVARRLREAGYNGALIAMSATAVAQREAALAAGCDAFVEKPIAPEDLLTLVARILQRGSDVPRDPAR